MQNKSKVLFGTSLAATIAAVLALAMPTIGAFYNVVRSMSSAERDIHATAHLAIPQMDEYFDAAVHQNATSEKNGG